MKAFFKKLLPNKENWLDIIEFVLLAAFYAIIPYILFCEAFGGITYLGSKLSLGMCVGVLLIIIVVKKMWLNDKSNTLRVRVGVMTDNLKVETDAIKKNRLANQIALKKMCLVLLNLIVPIVCIAAVVLVAVTMENTIDALSMLRQCIFYSGISFLMGVTVQIVFPFIRARICYKID